MSAATILRLAGFLLFLTGAGGFSVRSSLAEETPVPDEVERPGQEQETTGGLSNTLKWSTVREVAIYGYDVYRADRPDGPFVRITPLPIRGAGTSDEISEYVYLDETIEVDGAYYYYIESIRMDGHRARASPVLFAPSRDSKKR